MQSTLYSNIWTKKMRTDAHNRPIPELISYKLLRKMVGCIGFLLPIVLYVGVIVEKLWLNRTEHLGLIENLNFFKPESSISFYYYSVMGNVFVGMVTAIAIFLFAYKGHEKDPDDLMSDNVAGNFACVFALGVAFFPCNFCPEVDTISGTIHIICAFLFFSTLAYFSLVLFTKFKNAVTPKKIIRNKIYKRCGYTIIAALLFLGLEMIPAVHEITGNTIYFWAWEVVALWAFAFAWLVKGDYFNRYAD